MDMTLTYTNHKGESVVFGPDSIYHYGKHNLFDGSFDYIEGNDVISSFHRPPQERNFPIGITADSKAEGIAARNKLFRLMEIDVLAGIPGEIRYGDYVLRCYRISSERDQWWHDDRLYETTLTLLLPSPVWMKETLHRFEIDRSTQDTEWLNFPHGYPYNYGLRRKRKRLNVDALTDCKYFKLLIYGPAVSPYVTIGSNRYQVNVNVPSRGLLVIDSREELEPIMLYDAVGTSTNVFDKRVWGAEGSGTDIFCPIPAGVSDVYWDNSFGWDLIVYADRGEPVWIP